MPGIVPVLEESTFSPRSDFSHSLHCLDSGLDQLSVVSNGNVSTLFELDRRILYDRLDRFH